MTNIYLDDVRNSLNRIGSAVKDFATGVVEKIGDSIRSIKEKIWSEIKSETLTKLSSVKKNIVENFGRLTRSVVKRFNPDAGARMSMNHYAETLRNDLYIASLVEKISETNIPTSTINKNTSDSIDNLCNDPDLTPQQKVTILKEIEIELKSTIPNTTPEQSYKNFVKKVPEMIQKSTAQRKQFKPEIFLSSNDNTTSTQENSLDNVSGPSTNKIAFSNLTEEQTAYVKQQKAQEMFGNQTSGEGLNNQPSNTIPAPRQKLTPPNKSLPQIPKSSSNSAPKKPLPTPNRSNDFYTECSNPI